MHLKVIQDTLSAYSPKDIYEYAPVAGKAELRAAWRKKIFAENPLLVGKNVSNPIVTNGLTHGLSLAADLFVNEGDRILIHDKIWENYELTFHVRCDGEIVHYPFYNEDGQFNSAGLRESILAQKEKGKAIVVLNFPNNPTGYTPGAEEGQKIVDAIRDGAEAGINIVVLVDDAYFGLFYENSLHESLFSHLADLHPRVLAIRVDGGTKEDYITGLRVGFLTYAGPNEAVLNALESKTMGIIRATISSGPHPSQTFLLRALNSPEYHVQKAEKYRIMKGRGNKVKELLDSGRYDDAWNYYPFNSGYFMCLRLKNVNAEELRKHLLEHYSVGTIALSGTDLRIAFPCIEEDQLEDLFRLIYQGVKDLEAAASR
jgi:aspartate/methionine/tyrosine aminotransferase